MNRIAKLLIYLMVLFLFYGVNANGQGGAPAKAAEKPVESPEERTKKLKEKVYKKAEYSQDYQALPTEDPMLEVKNISFLRRIASSARGEFLDVQFNLLNKDTKTKEYAVYVLAVHEVEVPVYYPSSWRPSDPQKNIRSVLFQSLSPELIKEEDVLSAVTSPELTQYIQEKQRDAILDGQLVRQKSEPNLDDYIMYLVKNRDKALKVKVYGNDAPPLQEVLTSNLSVKKEELDRDVNYESEKQTYTVQSNKHFTTVTTHHFSLYRPDFLFYNKVVILVFDLERPRNQLIFRSVKDIGRIKMRT